jgi:hypothetical protein
MSKIAFWIKWEKEKEQLSFPSPPEKMLPPVQRYSVAK